MPSAAQGEPTNDEYIKRAISHSLSDLFVSTSHLTSPAFSLSLSAVSFQNRLISLFLFKDSLLIIIARFSWSKRLTDRQASKQANKHPCRRIY
jgi:hypothetical protein